MGPELLNSTQGDLTLQSPNPQEKEQPGRKFLAGQWGRKFFWIEAEAPRLLQTRSSYGCILVSPSQGLAGGPWGNNLSDKALPEDVRRTSKTIEGGREIAWR